jgi:hypothetical protein
MTTTLNFIRHSKEVARAVRCETYSWKILGLNCAVLNISFLRNLFRVIRVNKDNFTNMYTLNLFLLVHLHRWSCCCVYCKHNWFLHTHNFYLRYLLRKLPNLLTQSDFKITRPGLTHNLHRHWFFHNQLGERLLQKSILVGNMSIRGCLEQNPVYNLQLAKRLGLSKLKANTWNLHSCLDVNM